MCGDLSCARVVSYYLDDITIAATDWADIVKKTRLFCP